MQQGLYFLCLLVLGHASDQQVTPVQKVVSLLGGMLAKAKKEKHDEEIVFAESRQFCKEQDVMKQRDIKAEQGSMDTLEAAISKDVSTIAGVARKVSEIDKDSDDWDGDIKAAGKVREIEKEEYLALHRDYSESIDAMRRATKVIKEQDKSRPQEALLQLQQSQIIPENAKQKINEFLQETELDDDAEAPADSAYEFQSFNVVTMLEKLTTKFTDELTDIETEEVNAKAAFQLLVQDLRAQGKSSANEKTEHAENKAKTSVKKADETADLNQESKLKDLDMVWLKDLQSTCFMEQGDFEANQQVRTEEIEALQKAIDIISGKKVAGTAEALLPSFVQKKKSGTSLSQLRSTVNREMEALIQKRVAQLLKAKAHQLNSHVLAVVAERIAQDPYAKVKKMIKGLIVRLMEEANEEADHKGYCDTELSNNKQTRTEKSESVQTLQADIDKLEASLAKLSEDITTISKQVAALVEAISEETKIRTEEKEKNAATVKDAQEAQAAVAQAMTVLREFYENAAEQVSFAQVRQQPYEGQQSENKGVIGMLEVIESNFARLESETNASEASEQKAYDHFMADAKVDKAEKSKAIEHKKGKQQDETQALNENKADLVGTQKELDAALAYYEKLKPSCIDSGVTYEDRVARRKEEVESLQNALKILNGEDI
jgi:hypothetical protein